MKELEGWQCTECKAITIEFRKKKPPHCPHCKKLGLSHFERSKLVDPPFVILKMDNEDAGGKKRGQKAAPGSHPNQMPLPPPFSEPKAVDPQADFGGLF